MSAIDDLLERARRDISRVSPHRAAELARDGAMLVDTRPVEQRRSHGEIPGALVIDRNVLEWRLDPTSPHRHAAVTGPEQVMVVFCQEGYSSSLAVATLRQLGLRNVHDLDGGFLAWAAAGLPVVT